MQNIDLICVGKLNAKYFAEGVAEYQKRLAAFAAFRILWAAGGKRSRKKRLGRRGEKGAEWREKPSFPMCARGLLSWLCASRGQADLLR